MHLAFRHKGSQLLVLFLPRLQARPQATPVLGVGRILHRLHLLLQRLGSLSCLVRLPLQTRELAVHRRVQQELVRLLAVVPGGLPCIVQLRLELLHLLVFGRYPEQQGVLALLVVPHLLLKFALHRPQRQQVVHHRPGVWLLPLALVAEGILPLIDNRLVLGLRRLQLADLGVLSLQHGAQVGDGACCCSIYLLLTTPFTLTLIRISNALVVSGVCTI
mmetsp:Transcript_31419/g.60583  ORF Transcript_31419/g.60583 Transcript_31419/m.60583 type:complete len:218 (+) Transcript_31419:580-1233(+)